MEDLASWKEELAEQRSEYQLDLALRRAQRLEELEQLRKSLSELLDRHTFGQRRLLRAFPRCAPSTTSRPWSGCASVRRSVRRKKAGLCDLPLQYLLFCDILTITTFERGLSLG